MNETKSNQNGHISSRCDNPKTLLQFPLSTKIKDKIPSISIYCARSKRLTKATAVVLHILRQFTNFKIYCRRFIFVHDHKKFFQKNIRMINFIYSIAQFYPFFYRNLS